MFRSASCLSSSCPARRRLADMAVGLAVLLACYRRLARTGHGAAGHDPRAAQLHQSLPQRRPLPRRRARRFARRRTVVRPLPRLRGRRHARVHAARQTVDRVRAHRRLRLERRIGGPPQEGNLSDRRHHVRRQRRPGDPERQRLAEGGQRGVATRSTVSGSRPLSRSSARRTSPSIGWVSPSCAAPLRVPTPRR